MNLQSQHHSKPFFGVRSSRGTKPWYVGKAEKQPFRKECVTDNKLRIYYESLARYQRGTPVLHFIVRVTATGRISKPTRSTYDDIRALETMLIGRALSRNPNLCNVASTKILREMQVPGLLNDTRGKPPRAVTEFKKFLGL